MQEKGMEPEFSKDVFQQLSKINNPAPLSSEYVDLRSLLWCSIDNNDSRDLDQLTYAEKGADGKTMLWIAIADVEALVGKDSPIDVHARINATSVYTPAKIFTMLPEKLSTNLTSLNENEDRVSMVVKIQINHTGDIENSSIFQAIVRIPKYWNRIMEVAKSFGEDLPQQPDSKALDISLINRQKKGS